MILTDIWVGFVHQHMRTYFMDMINTITNMIRKADIGKSNDYREYSIKNSKLYLIINPIALDGILHKT